MQQLYAKWLNQWEFRLANVSTDRVVRPFEWGLDWAEGWPIPLPPSDGSDGAMQQSLAEWNDVAVAASDDFYSYTSPEDFHLSGNILRFTSAVQSPYPANNRVRALYLPATPKSGRPKRAVVVLPHWNSQRDAHNGLAKLIQTLGISAVRLSLPYHDVRMPAETRRADYAMSSNLCRTIDATRQAVIDVRSCLDWLEQRGYHQLGIVGTSIGSSYAFLASAHDERLRVNVFNHCSSYVADVVWTGLSTRHVKAGLESTVTLDELRQDWLAISPFPYIGKFAGMRKKSLFIYARYDTTFLPELSEQALREIQRHQPDCKIVCLPCGHYTTGETPYKYLDGYHIGRFLAGAFPKGE